MNSKTTKNTPISEEMINRLFIDFYSKAFTDGIIGHFFFGKDIHKIVEAQTSFTCSMLNLKASSTYRGRGLKEAHASLPPFKKVHLMRRRKLMEEVLDEHQIPKYWKSIWLKKELELESLVTSGQR